MSKYFNEVVNDKKLNHINDIFSQNYVSHAMDGTEVHCIQDGSLISFLTYLLNAFPDLHYTIDHILAEADIVALDLTATGTQKDEFLGYRASLKRIRYKEMYFFRISNNKNSRGMGAAGYAGIKAQIAK